MRSVLLRSQKSILTFIVISIFSAWNLNAQVTCGANETKYVIEIDLTNEGFTAEVSWALVDGSGTVVDTAQPGTYSSTSVFRDTVCLTDGSSYTFRAYDQWGDGWNGGVYSIYRECDNFVIADNGGSSPDNGVSGSGSRQLESTESFNGAACPPCPTGSEPFVIEIDLTNEGFTNEVSWALVDGSGTVIDTASPGTYGSTSVFKDTVCLVAGSSYTFRAHDEWGDGWNGGVYSIFRLCDNFVLANNGGSSPDNGLSGSGSRQLESTENFTASACPSCPAPSSLSAGNITSSAADLGWTENGTATVWDIEYGASGFTQGAGTTVTGVSTNPYSLSGLSANTAYDFYVRADCGATGQSPWAGPFTFTTLCAPFSVPFMEDFSTTSGTTEPNCWSQTSVSGDSWRFGGSVDFGPSTVRPDASGNSGEYARIDFSDDPDTTSLITPVIDVSSLTTPRLTFFYNSQTTSTSFTPYNRLIVDYWNGSNWVNFAVIDTLTPNGWSKYIFDLSTYKFNTNFVRIRFSAQEGGAAAGGSGTSTFDQDLMLDEVVVEETPSCLAPSGLSASNATASSVDLTWTENGTATVWDIEYGTPGFALGSGTRVNGVTNNNPYTLSGLASGTQYDVYVRSFCSASDTSFWTGPVTFATAFRTAQPIVCGSALPVTIFSEEFSANNGWTGDLGDWEIPGGASSSGTGPSSAHSGASNSYMNFEASGFPVGDSAEIFSPAIDLSSASLDAELSFWMHAFGSSMGTLKVAIGNSLTGPFSDIFTWSGQLQSSSSDAWQNIGVDLTAYTGQVVYLRFTQIHAGPSFQGDMSIDLVEVNACVTCPRPTALAANNITDNSADLSWTPGNTETTWEVEYGISGFMQGMGTSTGNINANNPYSLTGLLPGRDYDYYVRAVCGAGDSSLWAGPFTFSTPCSTPLNGSYTINAALPSSLTNFQSFGTAANVLAICGISGPVTFNIAPGVYNESMELPAIAGASALNTITFDGGDSALVQITHSSTTDEPTIYFNGADHVTIQNLTVSNTSSTDAWGMMFQNQSDSNTVNQVHFKMPFGTSSDVTGLVASNSLSFETSTGNNANYLTVQNSLFTGGENGMYITGGSSSTSHNVGHRILNNTFRDMDDYAIRGDGFDSLVVQGNQISNLQNNLGDGIYLLDVNDFTISGNTIAAPDWGIYITDGNDAYTPVSNSEVVNNMVVSSFDAGIYLSDVEYVNVFHNSTFGTVGMWINDDAQMDIRNNIFTSNGDFAFESSDPIDATTFLNYNLYFRFDAGDLADDGNSTYADLTAWQAADATRNINSVEADPLFNSNTDLHVYGLPANDVGTPIASVTTDIDGDSRSGTTPDIGADEYDVALNDAIAVQAYFDNSACNSINDTVWLEVTNGGINTITSLPVTFVVSGDIQDTVTNTVSVNIPAFATDTIVAGLFDTRDGGTFDITVFTQLANDEDHSNDTAKTSGQRFRAVPTITDVSCNGGNDGEVTVVLENAQGLNGNLTTSFNSNNGSGGNMFDINILRPTLEILGFEVNVDPGTHDVDIYYKTGTYVGDMNNAAAWTYAGQVTVTSAGTDAPTTVTLPNSLVLNSGIHGIFLGISSSSWNYYNGNGTGTLEASNTDLEIYEGHGRGSSSFTSGSFSPRVFSGSIIYQAGQASYAWSNGDTTETADTLAAGTYTLTVTDGVGCTNTISVAVDEPMPLAISKTVSNATCLAHTDGFIQVTPSGGTAPYRYIWNNGDTSATAAMGDTTGLGIGQITLQVIDDNNCVLHDTTNIVVEDTVAPVVNLMSHTAYLDATGNVTIDSSDVNNGSTDACGIATISLNLNSFTCAELGANTVTATVTDVNGNSASGTATVTVLDTISPALSTQPVTVYLDAAGAATVDSADIDAGTTDNCSVQSLDLMQTSFGCADVGTNMVMATATDGSGNTTTGMVSITVMDTVKPTLQLKSATVYINSLGFATVDSADVDNGSTDACGIASLEVRYPNPGCNVIGLTSWGHIVVVTDKNGNVDSAFVNVTVLDTTKPTVNTRDITVYLDSNGQVTVNPFAVSAGSFDVCGFGGNSLSQSVFTCADIGPNNVVYTHSDPNGNSDTGHAVITVLDTIGPFAAASGGLTAEVLDYRFNESGSTVTNQASNAPSGTGTATINGSLTQGSTGQDGTALVGVGGSSSTNYVATGWSTDLSGDWTISFWTSNIVQGTNLRYIFGDGSASGFRCFTGGVAGPGNWALRGPVTDVYTTGGAATGPAVTTFVYDSSVPEIRAYVNGVLNVTVAQPQLTATGSAFKVGGYSGSTGLGNGELMDNFKFFNRQLTPSEIMDLANNSGGTVSATSGLALNTPTVYLDANGQAVLDSALLDGGNTDNCAIASFTLSKTVVNCADIDSTQVEVTATDIHGNTTVDTTTVYVVDTVAPTVVSQDITIYLDGNGQQTIIPTDVNNGSSDACGIASLDLDTANFDCDDLGENPVVLTAIDVNGNMDTAWATVTVIDTVSPTVTTKNHTAYLDASGNATIDVLDVSSGSSSACSIDTVIVDITSFTCANLGPNTVNVTATASGGTASNSATATVTVVDTVSPTVVTQSFTTYLDASGNASIVPTDVEGGSTDNCTVAGYSVDISTFDCANLGANTVRLTVTDQSGNSSTATATVTVVDTIAPVAVSRDRTVYLDASGQVTITPALVNNGSADNCLGSAALSLSKSTYTCADEGLNQEYLLITDADGNVDSTDFLLTVLDTISPTLITKNITVQLGATGQVSIAPSQLDSLSSDNCSNQLFYTASKTTFNCSNLGSNTVTLTGTDVHGNSTSATAIVTVEDNLAPTVNTQSVTLTLDANGSATLTAAMVNNGSTDNCAISSYSLSQTAFTCADLGTNTIALTATDGSGNSASANATITVVDNLAPSATAQNATIQLDANGNATLTASMVNNGSTDNCAISSMSVSPSSFGCADVGPNTVTLTVTDASGNSSSTSATVTVQDNVAPVVATRNIAVSLDANGNASIVAADVNNGSSDACGISTLSVSPASFTCANIGANTVTLTATDVNGNSATGTAVVTVSDNMAPTVVTQSYTAVLDANGQATIAPSDVDNGSFDNCGIASYSLDVSTFTCNALGQNAVNLTVTDQSGNSATGTAIVSVVDNAAPTVSTQNITVQLNASGQVSIQPSQINSGSTDNCTIAGYSLDVSTFTCADVGANTVTLTATDGSGNSATGTATVTVQDNVAPNAVAQNITVQLDATGNATITAASVNNGSTDACGISSLSVSPSSFACADLGSNSVTLTVTDNNGNSSTAAATVTVVDNIAPTVITQNATVYLNASGTASITAADVNNGSTDNCSVSTTTVSQTSFSCADRGQNLVTLTVTDGSGNSASAGANVNVVDTISPSINNLPANITAYATAQSCAANVSWTNITGSDNCSVASVVTSQANGSSFNLGATTVNVTVTDGSGNTSSGSFTVTVVDTIAPVFTAVPTNISITPNQNSCDATVTWSAPSASDNCSNATITTSVASGSTFNVGSTTVTYTATDAAGNSRTGSFVVTVTDQVAPTISNTPANVVTGNDAGSCDAVVSYTMPSVGDNCSGATISSSHPSGSTFPLGTTNVTFTAIDGAGNTTTSSFTVTVEDREAPVATSVPTSDTVGQCNATYTYATPTGTDNCSAVTVRQIAGLPSGAVFPVGPTVNQFELVDAAGNKTLVNFTVVIVPQGTPQLPSLLEICANADPVEITLGQNITWSGNGIISGGTTFDPARAGAGRHALSYVFTDDEGCQVSGTIQVTVTPQPKKPVITKTASNTLSTGNYNDYQWYRDGVAISGATSQSYTYTVGGNYQVMVGNSFACTNYSDGFVVGSSGGGIGLDEAVLAGLEVYPNPSNGMVNIALKVGTDKELSVILFSIDGKKVYEKAGLKTNSTGTIRLDFGHLPTATYFLHIRTEDQVAVRKLLMN